MKTLVGAQPDDREIRRARYAWIAVVIRRPAVRLTETLRRFGS